MCRAGNVAPESCGRFAEDRGAVRTARGRCGTAGRRDPDRPALLRRSPLSHNQGRAHAEVGSPGSSVRNRYAVARSAKLAGGSSVRTASAGVLGCPRRTACALLDVEAPSSFGVLVVVVLVLVPAYLVGSCKEFGQGGGTDGHPGGEFSGSDPLAQDDDLGVEQTPGVLRGISSPIWCPSRVTVEDCPPWMASDEGNRTRALSLGVTGALSASALASDTYWLWKRPLGPAVGACGRPSRTAAHGADVVRRPSPTGRGGRWAG